MLHCHHILYRVVGLGIPLGTGRRCLHLLGRERRHFRVVIAHIGPLEDCAVETVSFQVCSLVYTYLPPSIAPPEDHRPARTLPIPSHLSLERTSIARVHIPSLPHHRSPSQAASGTTHNALATNFPSILYHHPYHPPCHSHHSPAHPPRVHDSQPLSARPPAARSSPRFATDTQPDFILNQRDKR